VAVTTEQDVYQGMDVVIAAAGSAGPVLGGAQNGEVTITHRKTPYAELNEQVDLQLPGKFTIEGRLMQAWRSPIAAAVGMIGASSIGRGIRTRPPKFTVTWTLVCPGKPDHGRRMQLINCSFSTMNWATRDAEGQVDNPVTFEAEGWALL
jgi:hypothetical protein